MAGAWKIRQNYKQARQIKEVLCDYRRDMVVQDQIEVKYKNEWYNATISNINENGSVKTLTIRYNPKDDSNGWDPFLFNTESFEWRDYNLNQEARLRYPGKLMKQKNEQGESQDYYWEAPDLVYREQVEDIQINDHVFVNFDGYGWRRAKVYQRTENQQKKEIWITVKNLTEWKSETLNLCNQKDRKRIQFRDMRKNNADVLTQLSDLPEA